MLSEPSLNWKFSLAKLAVGLALSTTRTLLLPMTQKNHPAAKDGRWSRQRPELQE